MVFGQNEMAREPRVDRFVEKRLDKIPRDYAERLREVIRSLANDPYFGDIQKMKGEGNAWRRRVGPYRVFYEIHDTFVYVYDLKRKTSTTYS